MLRHARRPAAGLIGRRMSECYPGIEQTQMFAVLSPVMQSRQPEQFLSPQLAQHVVTMHPEIRVLYISGFPQASALGGQEISARVSFLSKPFTPGTLLASVREALDT